MSNTLCTKNDTATDAEYSYTQRNEFTSEIYKIEVRNLGIFGIGEFKKLLRKQFSLDASKIKSPKRRDFAYVCFRSQADQEKAISILDGYVWKGKTLKVMTAKANPDPLVKRRREQQESKTDDKDNSSNSKKCKTSIEATCPLASLSYDEQLKYKENEMLDVLKLLGKDLLKVNSSLRKYFHKPVISKSNEDESNNDSVVISSHTNTTVDLLPCKFLGICPSPKIEGYRNKSEFTIGKYLNTNTEDVTKDANNKDNDSNIIVGFRLGSYANGSIEVGKIDNLPHIPDNVKKAAKSFELFVEKFSNKYQMFNPENNSGHFRQLCVRSTEMNNDIMIIIGVYSQNLTETQLNELKSDLIEFYKNYETNDEFNLKSLYYQDMKRREIGQLYNPTEHLYGDEHIYDMIHGLKFRISPLAFFQVNTKGAEILYQKAIELANITKNTTVLDICCGTGTIGLCFAKHCKQVIGVDVIDDAIKDAEYNAKVNNIDNVKFYSGNSDDFIQSMVREASYGYLTKDERDLLAVIDPPRAGLHNKSILAIRNSSNLNRLIYISCNPKSAKRNWIDLCRPESKTYRGAPFIPKLAMAVDMFPHTTHTELIILFERIQDEDEDDKVKVNKETTTATTNENVVMETEEIVNETEFLSNQENKKDNNTMEITDDKNLDDKIEDEKK